jgi:ABC-type histidine transport system ATPase subunit
MRRSTPIQVLKQDCNEVIERARSLLEKVKLVHKADAYPGELSGGQQQRVVGSDPAEQGRVKPPTTRKWSDSFIVFMSPEFRLERLLTGSMLWVFHHQLARSGIHQHLLAAKVVGRAS